MQEAVGCRRRRRGPDAGHKALPQGAGGSGAGPRLPLQAQWLPQDGSYCCRLREAVAGHQGPLQSCPAPAGSGGSGKAFLL